MNKKFVKVYNEWLEFIDDKPTIISRIGTDGFTLWFYLRQSQGGNDRLLITIKKIMSKLNIRGFKQVKNIKEILHRLHIKGFVEVLDIEIDKIRANECIEIKIRDFYKETKENFSPISCDLFDDYIHNLGHIGFAIYCLLYKNHNINFGNQISGNVGFASCSEEYIARILGFKSRQTIYNNLKNINSKLIKVEKQEPQMLINEFGKEELQYMPNHYFVKAKYNVENKYYINLCNR